VESINLDHASLAFLLKYQPPAPEPQARCEHRRFQAGVKADGRVYKSRLPTKTGDTYLLRSIVYDTYDVLVAFQVVRQESDGSVTIAWKLLKKFSRANLEPVPNLNQRTLTCPPSQFSVTANTAIWVFLSAHNGLERNRSDRASH